MSTRAPAPAPEEPAGSVAGRVGYLVVFGLSLVVALAWLGLGAVVAAVRYLPGLQDTATAMGKAGNTWAAAAAAGAPLTEPLQQLVLDYGLTALNLVIALVLLLFGGRSWSIRLLALAMVGSAGAFNLQAHAAATAMEAATGVSLGEAHQVVLHGIACAAFILALLLFPTPQAALLALPARVSAALGGEVSRGGRLAVGVVGLVVLGLTGFGTALLRHTTSCVLFFGFLVPLTGLLVLPARIRRGPSAQRRTQARLVFALLVAAFVVIVVLGLVTVALWGLHAPGLSLYDPTAHGSMPGNTTGQPVALLFWSSRLGAAAVAVAMLIAVRADGLWRAERIFGAGLAGALTIAVVAGGFVIIQAAGIGSGLGAATSALVAALPAAAAFLPVYRLVERVSERMLYGARPTPYAALAEVAALARGMAADGPDLARIPEEVGRAVGAAECRLTVLRPGLRDRTYRWTAGGPRARVAEAELLSVPIRSGDQQVGSLAVDRGAVAGLYAERRRLLEDVADSLGVVVVASRLGVELERQLRAALAHATEIAASRRQAVSEMDAERRRIERDLHDGAQHQLVSLRLVLGLVEHEVENGRVESAAQRLGVLAGQLDTAESVLAETASGVRSMVLVERGLVAALEAELAGPDTMVTVESALRADRRYPPEIEAAVYFCCLESVNNAHKHAPGAPVHVRFAEEDGRLLFTVRDEGPGFELPDPGPVGPVGAQVVSAGRGLRNVATRLVAAGGRVDLQSAPGKGTTVEGSVPVPPPPAVADTPAAPAAERAARSEAPRGPSAPPVATATTSPGDLAETGDTGPDTIALPSVRLSGPVDVVGRGERTAAFSIVDPDALTTALHKVRPGPSQAAQPRAQQATVAEPVGSAVPEPGGSGVAEPGARPVPSDAAVGTTSAEPDPGAEEWESIETSESAEEPQGTGTPAPGAPSVPIVVLPPREPRPAAGGGRTAASVRAGGLPARLGALARSVEDAVAQARRAAGPELAARFDAVLDAMHRPLRVGLAGTRGAAAPRALAAVLEPPGGAAVVEVDPQTAEVNDLDALVLVLGPEPPAVRPGAPSAVGVLVESGDEAPDAGGAPELERVSADPAVRRRCHAVLSLVPELDRAAAGLRPADLAALRCSAAPSAPPSPSPRPGPDTLRERLGPAGLRIAATLAAEGGDAPQVAAELRRRSGLPRLRELLALELSGHVEARRVRTALRRLDALAAELPSDAGTRLRYQLDRIRTGAYELGEADVVDVLRSGLPGMPDDEREVAERLLGACGRGPRERLGLPASAGAAEIRLAAAAQLAHWQRCAAQPVAAKEMRDAAEALAHTCERLVAEAAAGSAERAQVSLGEETSGDANPTRTGRAAAPDERRAGRTPGPRRVGSSRDTR